MLIRLLLLVLTAVTCFGQVAGAKPAIPRVWDDAAMSQLDLPLATPGATPRYPSASYYYSIPELVIYKSYPSRPPSGMTEEQYLDWLRRNRKSRSILNVCTRKRTGLRPARSSSTRR